MHYRTRHRGQVGTQQTTHFPVRALRVPQGISVRAEGSAVRVSVPDVVLEEGRPAEVSVEALPYVLVDTLPGLRWEEAVVVLDAVLSGRYGFGVKVTDQGLNTAEQALGARPPWRELRAFADPRSESVGESRARALFDKLGFMPPRLQQQLHLPGIGRVRPDFMWDNVICEFDGRVKYTRALAGNDPEETVYREKLREDALRAAGFAVVRITWDDLSRPDHLAQKLLTAGVPHRALLQFTVV